MDEQMQYSPNKCSVHVTISKSYTDQILKHKITAKHNKANYQGSLFEFRSFLVTVKLSMLPIIRLTLCIL